MENLKLEGFLGITFGSSQEDSKKILKTRNGIIDSQNSNENSLLYDGIKFAGHITELVILSFYEDKLAKASVYIKPELESRIVNIYIGICDDLNKKYYVSTKNFETYDYPYEKNDGHTETAISLGNADFSCFWNFINIGKEDDYISVSISERMEIIISYENGELNNLLVNKHKENDALDY